MVCFLNLIVILLPSTNKIYFCPYFCLTNPVNPPNQFLSQLARVPTIVWVLAVGILENLSR